MRCEEHEGEIWARRPDSGGLHRIIFQGPPFYGGIGAKLSAGGPIGSQSVWLAVNGGKIQPHIFQNTPNALQMINNYSRRQLTRRRFSERLEIVQRNETVVDSSGFAAASLSVYLVMLLISRALKKTTISPRHA